MNETKKLTYSLVDDIVSELCSIKLFTLIENLDDCYSNIVHEKKLS